MKIFRALWWFAFLFSLAVLVGSLPGYWAQVNRGDLAADFSEVQRAALWLGAFLSIASAALCLALALLLIAKKQNDGMALYLAFYLLMYGIFLVGPLEHFLPYWFPSSGDLALQLQGVVFGLPTLVLILIFPNGRFEPRWTRWLVVAGVVIMLGTAFSVRDLNEVLRINTPAAQTGYALLGVWFVIASVIQVFRYRHIYTSAERQQTKWILYGFLASFGLLLLVSIPYTYLQNLPPGTPQPWWFPLNGVGWWFGLMIQPLALTIAILRARLWDIDVIVRRTLTYALVTGLLVAIYFGSVIVLQRIFAGIAGEQPEFVTVLSTLAIAALFVPLRNKIQDAIDKRFNRKKYDAQKVLQKFAETVRDETDIDKLTAELVNVVNETMQPRSVSLWLKRTDDGRRTGK
ncbi:MAG: hypothetical protein EYC68_02860 [Chloroflexota bacterium]|nr:MAG: hypothetical protein EYC68_02860 [Chloroflexota bacterium]